MSKEEEGRHERQAVHGYLGQANPGVGQSNISAARGTRGAEVTKERAMADEEAEAQAERELSNRPWGAEDITLLQQAVDE